MCMLASCPFSNSSSRGTNHSGPQGTPGCRNQRLQCQIMKCFTGVFNQALALPALQRGKTAHTVQISRKSLLGVTHEGVWVGCSIKTADSHSPYCSFHILTGSHHIATEFPPAPVQLSPPLARSYINPHPSFTETTYVLKGRGSCGISEGTSWETELPDLGCLQEGLTASATQGRELQKFQTQQNATQSSDRVESGHTVTGCDMGQ